MNQHILSQISSSVYINTTYLQGEQSHKNQNSGIEIIPLGKFFFFYCISNWLTGRKWNYISGKQISELDFRLS